MKKLFFYLLALISLCVVSCSDDDDNSNKISFEFEQYTLGYETPLELKLTISSPAAEDFLVPFKISGTAVEGEEYTISAKKFEFKKGEKVATVTLNHKKNYSPDKNITITLESVAGYDLGKKTAIISIGQSEKYKYSFRKSTYSLASVIEVELDVTDMKGASLGLQEDLHFPFKFSDESTAKLGEHFMIEGMEEGAKLEFIVPKGGRTAKLKFKVLSYNKDCCNFKIVPDVNENMYAIGKYEMAEVVITPTVETKMAGTWIGNSFESEQYLKDLVFYYHKNDADNLPVNISNEDEITFDISGEKPQMKVNLKGDLKNYFRDCTLTFIKDQAGFVYFETQAGTNPPEDYTVLIYKMSVCNAAFSATETKEREAEIAIYVRESGDQEFLDLIITDCSPTEFLVESLKDNVKLTGEDRLSESHTMRYTFVRKK